MVTSWTKAFKWTDKHLLGYTNVWKCLVYCSISCNSSPQSSYLFSNDKTFLFMAKTQGTTLHRCVKLLFKTCTPGFAIVVNYGPIFCISKAFYFLEVSKTACQPHAVCRVGRVSSWAKRKLAH